MPKIEGIHPCPVCGEKINLSNKNEAYTHMMKDEKHKKHLENTKTNLFLNQACDAGILRRTNVR